MGDWHFTLGACRELHLELVYPWITPRTICFAIYLFLLSNSSIVPFIRRSVGMDMLPHRFVCLKAVQTGLFLHLRFRQATSKVLAYFVCWACIWVPSVVSIHASFFLFFFVFKIYFCLFFCTVDLKLICVFDFYRETSSIDLIRQIVQFHPQLVGYEANKLAIYEKSWHPGKTSRGYNVKQIITSFITYHFI